MNECQDLILMGLQTLDNFLNLFREVLSFLVINED